VRVRHAGPENKKAVICQAPLRSDGQNGNLHGGNDLKRWFYDNTLLLRKGWTHRTSIAVDSNRCRLDIQFRY
jgi:hypothetical protein